MNDLISRQMAIDSLMNHLHLDADYLNGYSYLEELKHLPSVQPQKMRGRWDFIGWNQYACTACQHQFYSEWLEGWASYTNEPLFPNFCPNCGAQMK